MNAPPFPNEPAGIHVGTAIPGPQSEALRARHGKVQDARTVHFYQDARRSLGKYIVDEASQRFDLTKTTVLA